MRKMNFDIPTRIIDLAVFAAEKLPGFGLGQISSDVRGGEHCCSTISSSIVKQLRAD